MTAPSLLGFGWALVSLLKFGGLAAIFSGIGLFGWYFVLGNTRAAQADAAEIPSSAWRGRGPVTGMLITGAGFFLTFLAIALATLLPNRL